MKVAIIHGNYPGQFRNLCAGLAANTSNQVCFLTEKEVKEEEVISRVEIHRYSMEGAGTARGHYYLKSTEDSVRRGQTVIRTLVGLAERGFVPDLIIFNGGSEIFPTTTRLFASCT